MIRPRFSLRTLFVGVTLICCWLGYQLNWIRQRHAALEDPAVIEVETLPFPSAPLSLRPFGEVGHCALVPRARTEREAAKLRRLFPEADILLNVVIDTGEE